MQYQGGKSYSARQLSNIMLSLTEHRQIYIEPFVGAGSVAMYMAPEFDAAYLSDISADLIVLWKQLQEGWMPPENVSE